MSKLEQTIIDGAATTQGTTYPITDLNKITQVMIACKILGKEFTGAALRKLLKRYEGEPTEEEIAKLYAAADDGFTELKHLKREEKINLVKKSIPDELPSYVVECIDEDGEPTGNYTIDYIKYSDFLNRDLHIHNLSKTLFVYDKCTHTHREHVNQVETHCRDTFKQFSIVGKLTDAEREIVAHVRSMGCVAKYPFVGKFGTIHVLNGCLNLDTGELSEPSSDSLYDYRIETAYKQFPNGTPELDAFLNLYGTREPVDILAKTIWQRAYHDTLKELTIFVGPRDCGKTTLVELIQATLDGDLKSRNNVSRTLLQDLLQRFGYADLEGRLLNFGDDLPDMFVKNAGRINELVGSVVRHIEKKGIDGYDAVVTAYYVFTTNNLPPLDDDDNAIWSKIRLVQFDKEITGDKTPRTELFTQIIKEQLLYRAIEKALSYRAKPYVKDQSPEYVRKLWHESSTDVDAFLREVTEFDPASFTPLDKIKEHYEKWCISNSRRLHIKYLNKKLQPYFRRQNTSNGYTLKLLEKTPTTQPDISGICNQRVLSTPSH